MIDVSIVLPCLNERRTLGHCIEGARRTLDVLKQNGWSNRRVVPHGGHQMSLNIVAGLRLGGNESYPDVFRPFGGFADDADVVEGHIRLPDRPGVGFEAKSDLFALLRKELQA